jgi:threonine dehydratase
MKKMVEFQDVKEAHLRIKDLINRTPVMSSRTLNEMLKAEVYFKCENFQRIGAFKMRGAINTVSQLTAEQKAKGVITHSSGNHAQALALSAKLLGIKAVIVMPETSPQVKVNATRDTYGAEVVLCQNTIQARQDTAQKLIDEHGYTMVHPYDNDNIIAGAGTAALELLTEHPDLDVIFCPVGGGGLLSGTLIASKGFKPTIEVYAAEPKNVDDASRSLKEGKIMSNAVINSIADGLLTNLSERTFAIIQKYVNGIITVSEHEILKAMRFIWERMKLVVEPSGAVSLAAAMAGQLPIQGKKVGIIISGGNIDLNDFFNLLEKKIK